MRGAHIGVSLTPPTPRTAHGCGRRLTSLREAQGARAEAEALPAAHDGCGRCAPGGCSCGRHAHACLSQGAAHGTGNPGDLHAKGDSQEEDT